MYKYMTAISVTCAIPRERIQFQCPYLFNICISKFDVLFKNKQSQKCQISNKYNVKSKITMRIHLFFGMIGNA